MAPPIRHVHMPVIDTDKHDASKMFYPDTILSIFINVLFFFVSQPPFNKIARYYDLKLYQKLLKFMFFPTFWPVLN